MNNNDNWLNKISSIKDNIHLQIQSLYSLYDASLLIMGDSPLSRELKRIIKVIDENINQLELVVSKKVDDDYKQTVRNGRNVLNGVLAGIRLGKK